MTAKLKFFFDLIGGKFLSIFFAYYLAAALAVFADFYAIVFMLMEREASPADFENQIAGSWFCLRVLFLDFCLEF